MQGQIKLLVRYSLCNIENINKIRYTKDKKQKRKQVSLLCLWGFVILLMLLYISAFDFGLISLGMVSAVPIYSAVLASVIVLIVTAFQAPGVLFSGNDYDFLASLPLKRSTIVTGRMLALYLPELAFAALAVLPGFVLYGLYGKPDALYWIFGITGTLLLPLLPITLATLVGTLIAGISSGMKHKSIVASILSILVVIGIVLGSMLLPQNSEIGEEGFRNLAGMIRDGIAGMYPPALWISDAMTGGNVLLFLLFTAVSLAAFAVMLAIVTRFFPAICEGLRSHAHGKKYRGGKFVSRSPLKALFRKELRRYFASSVYMTNTVIGYILMALLSGALFFVGVEPLEQTLGMPGVVRRAFPFLLGATACITTTTSCAVSMEGKQWWLVQTLPLRNRDVLMSKILVNYAVAAPFFVLSSLFSCLAAGSDVATGFRSILVPAVYIVFMAEVGLAVNLKFPVFDWENETGVVKQGNAVLFTILIGFISFLVPIGILTGLPGTDVNLVSAAASVLLLIFALLLHMKNIKTDLSAV